MCSHTPAPPTSMLPTGNMNSIGEGAAIPHVFNIEMGVEGEGEMIAVVS